MAVQREIVLVADRTPTYEIADLYSRNLEMANDFYFDSMHNALQKTGRVVHYYSSPENFVNQIKNHIHSVVLSTWSGENSRNRRILIPAICEAANIPYVGADAYMQAICQDKDLAKYLCSKYGIKSPAGKLVFSEQDLPQLNELEPPIIVKPNNEGGSIGIFSTNVVDHISDAKELCCKMLSSYRPILVEEFVPGEEIYICIVGTQNRIDVFQAIRQYLNGKTFFEREILGAEDKKMSGIVHKWDCITPRISAELRKQIENLYFDMGKVEVMRVDGKLNKHGFFAIELSVDNGLSPHSTIPQAFETQGVSYDKMFEILINNAIEAWELQNANT